MKAFLSFSLFLLSALFSTNTYSLQKTNTEVLRHTICSAIYQHSGYPPFIFEDNQWIDSVYNSLTAEQKIAQLFMIEVARNETNIDKTIEQIKKYNPGGLIFFKSSALITAQKINRLQNIAQTKMLTAIDAEWGLAMRLDSTMRFPVAMALGATDTDSMAFKVGNMIGKQCKNLGINMNLAPDVDVNNNPKNPVINYRSFGENPYKVAQKGVAFMQGMQNARILACAKHFPGHGDTDKDSHKSLPVVNKSYEQLQQTELIPFRQMVVNGVSSVMTAHLSLPQLDNTKYVSATISAKIQSILRDSMNFQGLIITDALNMQGVAKYFPQGKLEVMAIKAGADILLMPQNIPVAIKAIKEAIKNKELSWVQINRSCKRILQAKYWLGLANYRCPNFTSLHDSLYSPAAKKLQQQAFRQVLTVINNKDSLLPLRNLAHTHFASLALAADTITLFQQQLDKYQTHKHFFLPKNASKAQITALWTKLQKEDSLIISLQRLWLVAKHNYGLTQAQLRLLKLISKANKTVIFTVFGNPYTLAQFDDWQKFNAVIIAYQDNDLTESFAAQLIYGAQGTDAHLPVGINSKYPAGTGIKIQSLGRLKYGIPEDMGMNSHFINRKMDSIAQMAIEKGAFPGCQILVAKNDEVIFHKTYGFLTYDKHEPVHRNDIYDMASVTKVLTSVPSIMYFVSKGKLHLQDKISDYYKPWRHSNKKKIIFIDALTHQARLRPWIPFYKSAKSIGLFHRHVFSGQKTKRYSLTVAKGMYENKHYPKHIYKQITKSPLLATKTYKYSDLSFYIYPKIIEKLSETDFETFLRKTFYLPLGADQMHYNAWKYYPLNRIVPTERDSFFRMQLLRGYVHDEGAAMLNGISGHAGMFATADDLAKIMQMYVQLGKYADKRYISKSVFQIFTSRPFAQEGNRRGIGFDKSYINNQKKALADAYPSPLCSESSFGHGGYTGTFVWADPANQLVFIFLSNRVYPTRENRKIYQLNIRPAMQQVFYQAVNKAK